MTTEEAVLFTEQYVGQPGPLLSVKKDAESLSLYFEIKSKLYYEYKEKLDELIEALILPVKDRREEYLFCAAYHALDTLEKRTEFTNKILSVAEEIQNMREIRMSRSMTEKINKNMTELRQTLNHFQYSLKLRMWIFARRGGFDDAHFFFTQTLYEFIKDKKREVEAIERDINYIREFM